MTPTPELDQHISQLEDRLSELKARQQRIEARKLALQVRRDRKAETRRKILIGGVVLDRIAAGQISESELRAWLDPALSRSADRALFGLDKSADR
ncbi:MAG: mobilization protein [Pseudomonadota bacterium]